MSLFGPVIGNLPLLQLPATKLAKLSGQDHWNFMDQLRHQCIRMGWLQSMSSGKDVRLLVELAVGRAHLALAGARGGTPVERFIEMDMEHARRENEWWSCFGFFLEDEVRHIFDSRGAGPILRDRLPAEAHALGIIPYAGVLRDMLGRYRENIRANPLTRATVEFVQMVTGKTGCVEDLPEIVSAYFDLGELMEEILSESGDSSTSTTLH